MLISVVCGIKRCLIVRQLVGSKELVFLAGKDKQSIWRSPDTFRIGQRIGRNSHGQSVYD